jgi:hypothetical protein
VRMRTGAQTRRVLIRAFPRPSITVREVDNVREAETLLPPAVLARLCSRPAITNMRQRELYRSRIVVAFDGESPVGFAAYRPTEGRIRVAHEFWIDPHARCGQVLTTEAIVTALEEAARAAKCSRLIVLVARPVPLRHILENSGYFISLGSGEITWFEKSLAGDGPPLESA